MLEYSIRQIAFDEKEPAKSTTLPKKFTTKRKHSAKGEDEDIHLGKSPPLPHA